VVSSVALRLDLLDLRQDVRQLGVVKGAATATSAVDTESSGTRNESSKSGDRNHIGGLVNWR